jgi:RsiW-degrading membrane proteinase PrsW (M82 family)
MIGRSLPLLSVVLPLKAWWEGKEWRQGYSLIFLVFGIAPWVILHSVGPDSDVTQVAWGFSIYFAVLWAMTMWTLIRPGRLDAKLVAKVVLGSAIVGVPLAIALENGFGHQASLSGYILGVGIPEEVAKALPVFLFMLVLEKRSFTSRTYMYMGALSGLAFGVVESVRYASSYVAAASQMTPSSFVNQLVWRLLTDSFFHACSAAIVCYFVGLAASNAKWRAPLIAFGLGLAAVLHGFNDRYSDGGGQVIVAATLVFIFLGYVRTGEKIEQQVMELAQHETPPGPVTPAAG